MRRLISLAVVVWVTMLATRGVAADAAVPWGAERKSTVLASGMTMGYVELGDSSKPVLVFLHGFTNSSLGYLPLGRLLAVRYHVFLLDQRGHGATDKPECCYTRLDYAHDAKLFLDKMGIARACRGTFARWHGGANVCGLLAGAGRQIDGDRLDHRAA